MRSLFLVLALACVVLPASAQDAIVLSPRVGDSLDAAEIRYFRLFPLIQDAERAVATPTDAGIALDVAFRDARGEAQSYRYVLTAAQAEALGAYVERFESRDEATEALRAAVPAEVLGRPAPDASRRVRLGLVDGSVREGRLMHVDDDHALLWTAGPYDWQQAPASLVRIPLADVAWTSAPGATNTLGAFVAPASVAAAAGASFTEFGRPSVGAAAVAAALGWLPALRQDLRIERADDAETVRSALAPRAGASVPPEAALAADLQAGAEHQGPRDGRFRLSFGATSLFGSTTRYSGSRATEMFAVEPFRGEIAAPTTHLEADVAVRIADMFAVGVAGAVGGGGSDLHTEYHAGFSVAPYAAVRVFSIPSVSLPYRFAVEAGAGYLVNRTTAESSFAISESVQTRLYDPNGVARSTSADASASGPMLFVEGDFRVSQRASFVVRVARAQLPAVEVEERGVHAPLRSSGGGPSEFTRTVYLIDGYRLNPSWLGLSLMYRVHL